MHALPRGMQSAHPVRRVLGAVLLLWAIGAVARSVTVTTIARTHVLNAEAYNHDIIRLTLRSASETVFEPHGVVVTQPTPLNNISFCDSPDRCTVRVGSCHMDVIVDEASVAVNHSCGNHVLSTAVISLSAPNVTFHFPQAKTMYGLAEHAADLPLRQGQRYELYNTDAFKYPVNSTKALYGSIPFLMAYSAQATTGVLFLNAAEMNVDILESEIPGCQWNAEVGVVDLYFMPGPTPNHVQRQHAYLTGPTLLPPYFSLGFHQCRWNYLSTKDCLAVDEGFDRHNMPYDVLWLDIEHTQKKKYFTWDNYAFPDPKVLTDALAAKGRKLVTIKDPHVKTESGYVVHDEATKGGYYIKNAEGSDYTGECWPGVSSWPDFLNKRTRDWYATFFHDKRYPGGSRDIHTWVDMNEPSVFQGERGTMKKDAVHTTDDGIKVQHRFVHNAYSLYSIMSVFQGTLEARGPEAKQERAFILTRSFFAGSQRYAAMWNGDNMAQWDHLQNTGPQLLSLSLCNYPFSGADIGGFFYETEEDLFVRWMQAGVFYPFMRAHAHLETKRREPWTFSVSAQQHIRNALALRYALLPYLYTVFYHAHHYGDAILRPLFYEFPVQEELREEQQAFMFGPALLARPVVEKDATEVAVIFPKQAVWYAYHTGELIAASEHHIRVDLSTIPFFLRGGYIVPMKLRLRRDTHAARFDPITLNVALTPQGNSYGDLYLDDGVTYDYQAGMFVHRMFSYSSNELRCTAHVDSLPNGNYSIPNIVERVVVYGYQGNPTTVAVMSEIDGVTVGRQLEFERVGSTIIVRKPEVLVSADWTMSFGNT